MTDKVTTEDLLRQRFAAACAERDAILAEAAPHRRAYDELQANIEKLVAGQRQHAETFRKIEKPLADIKAEIARLSRALSGKTATVAASKGA